MQERFLIDPLFHEALSGEFYPQTDPHGRAHTLARLSIATVTKGEREKSGDQTYFAYHPSWAPNMTTSVECTNVNNERLAILGVLVGFTASEDFELSVFNSNLGLAVALKDVHSFPLSLGDELNRAREFVTVTAQKLFDQAT